MRTGWLGVVLLWLGLYIDLCTANSWGQPAIQPWFFIGGVIAGAGMGSLIFTISRLERELVP